MSLALTAELGKFVANLRYRDIPAEALNTIRMAFADTVGVAIAGAGDPAPQLLMKMLAPAGGEATLIGSDVRAAARDAAWINGTAAHALDYDDVAQRGGHASAVLVPAILAEAEVLGATGEQMALAYAAGFEVFADIARRDADVHHEKGWHPTSVFGVMGAAAACASLRGLDARQAAMAIGISASQSSGVVSNFGSMTKPFHAGIAAHAGVVAARLAALGFTSAPDALEHEPGLLTAVSPAGRMDLDSPLRAGVEWQICGSNQIGIKKYPACYCVHRSLDGMLDLLKKQPIAPDDVARVNVSYSPRNVIALRNHAPQTGLEAKFSIEFAVAAALLVQRAGLTELTDDFVRRPDVQSLMTRVSGHADTRLDPRRPGYSICDEVVIDLRDGRRLETGPITQIRGDAGAPLRHDELWAKFEDCVRTGQPQLSARPLFDALMTIDRLPDARTLVALLAGRSRAQRDLSPLRKAG
ncbi:MAG: MmgE/PrpD family protein [Burkholderiales bacterium]